MARKQPIIWAVLQIFLKIFRSLPHKVALFLGAGLGRALAFFSKKHTQKAVARCERILHVDRQESLHIVRGAYAHFGKAAVEFARMGCMNAQLKDLITIHGEEHLVEAYNAQKGVILLSAHIGNWEYAGARLVQMGYPVNAIGAEQRDERITDLIASLRQSVGITPLGKGMDLKGAIRCLQRGEILAVLLDQDARDNGVIAPFLDQPASTPIGPLKLAHKLGTKILPAYTVRREKSSHYDFFIEPALQGEGSTPFGADLVRSATQCNDAISRWIRAYPDQWLWMYPRWASTLGDR